MVIFSGLLKQYCMDVVLFLPVCLGLKISDTKNKKSHHFFLRKTFPAII